MSNSRDLANRSTDFVSVKDFGAVGDGVTDDTAAINAALAAANSVYLPPGTYRVTSTISLATRKTLYGPAVGTIHYQPAKIYHDPSATGPCFSVTTGGAGSSIRNVNIYGGNGDFAVSNSDAWAHYEMVIVEQYTGSGFTLLDTGSGSWNTKLINCRWVGPGPNVATAYKGAVIDTTGGDVHIIGFTATYGAIGIEIVRGQTVIIDRCNINKQTKLASAVTSSAPQFETCGIRLTGADAKQSITIRGSYIEGCDNSIYVEACESLSIEDCWIDDRGVAGRIGATYPVGNSLVNLTSSNCKNVTLKNNNLLSLSNGNVTDPFYLIRASSASYLLLLNNSIQNTTGSQPAYFNIQSVTTAWTLANRFAGSGTLQPDVTTGSAIVDLGAPFNTRYAVTYQNSWVNYDSSSAVTYRKDAWGMVHVSGISKSGTVPAVAFNLPAGFRPYQQEAFVVMSGATYGRLIAATNGDVSVNSGDPAYVYMNFSFKAA